MPETSHALHTTQDGVLTGHWTVSKLVQKCHLTAFSLAHQDSLVLVQFLCEADVKMGFDLLEKISIKN